MYPVDALLFEICGDRDLQLSRPGVTRGLGDLVDRSFQASSTVILRLNFSKIRISTQIFSTLQHNANLGKRYYFEVTAQVNITDSIESKHDRQ